MTDVLFPAMSAENAEATGLLATWFVQDGEQVAAGQLVAEVQMDKVDAEVLAPVAGTIHPGADEGSEVRQGSVIGTID
jgi:pyruvate/2-oxoglutarate dehydrogenase complex dihydrolipoamide acyltransferase (E2) component